MKAKIMFLGDTGWRHIFEPILWRSSPHYPLLLPLTNVWGWTILGEPTYKIPVLTSFLYTLLTLILLCFGLKKYTKTNFTVLPIIVLLTLPFFVKLALSQYCDIVLGFYLLASLFCLITAKTDESKTFSFLAGIFIGILSFTKGEGLVAALIILLLSIPYLLYKRPRPVKTVGAFFMGASITFIPTIIFQLLYAPENQTFINGITSVSHPATWIRLTTIFKFFLVEVSYSPNWHGLWMVLLLGFISSIKRCFNPTIIILPLFFFSYAMIISFYYYLNTYFRIALWMQDTLHRILFAILPTVIFWIFYSIWQGWRNEGSSFAKATEDKRKTRDVRRKT